MKLSDLSPPKEIATPKWKFKLQEFWRCSTHHDRLDMQVMLRMGDRNGATKLLESWTPPQPATETTQPAKTPKRKFQYGSYGGWFYPGYHNNSGTDKSSDGADSNPGIQESQDIDSILNDFTKQCCSLLGIKTVPKINLRKDSAWSQRNGSFGRFDHDNGVIELALANRHPVDVMRTLAHELVHHRQGEVDENLPADAGKTGSRYENEANAVAGQIMRSVAKNYPEVFGKEAIDEGWREKAGALATAACIAGSPGCATTADTVRGVQDVGRTVQTFKGYGTAGAKEELAQRLKNELRRRQGQLPEDIADEDYNPNSTPPGPEFKPTMPAGTVKVDVSDVYDWYKLGQHISNLKGLGQHDFGSGPPSTIMAFGSEEEEHKYIDALKQTGLTTTDIDPVDPNQPKGMPRQKTDPTYNVSEAVTDNYLYHATMPAGMMRMLRTGIIKATDRPQASTKAKTQYPTISTTRSKQYAESNEFVDFLNLTNDGNAVILVFDRNAVANHYKMFSTSQGTQTVGDEYEEVIVAPKGLMPIKGTLKGFYFNPKRTAEIQEYQDVPWFQELLNSPYYMGPKQDVNEAFDQPYRLRWERGDHGDLDAIAKLDDGNYLSIMFNKEQNQDGEEAWSVEFYRNNSQEVTGEGDAQRVFATVLSAIQIFIKKYKPNRVTFSASKEVEQGQNAQSRARLYDSLVQRYARAWGYRAFRADTGNKVIYELNRIKSMAEGQEKFNMDLMKPGFRWSQEINGITYLVRTQWDNMPEVVAKVNNREVGRATFIDHHTQSGLESVSTYVNPKWQGHGIAKNMYAVVRMLGANIQPSDTQTAMGKSMWDKWKQAGDTKHLTKLNAKPEQPGLAEATGYIPVNDKEARDPRYSMAITQDIKPGEVQRQARKMGFKTTAAGLPPTLKASGKL